MLLVAFLWSLTSAFDKMGMAASPTLAAYLAVQRAITAVPCVLYLVFKDIQSFRCACWISFRAVRHGRHALDPGSYPTTKNPDPSVVPAGFLHVQHTTILAWCSAP
jgi:hypothetical protein